MTEQPHDHRAEVHRLPPLVRPDQPVPVVVLDEGEWWPGFASAWRGERVSVEFTKMPGMKYVKWVPANRVKRVSGLLQDVE